MSKDYYVKIKGKKVEVTEEVYRACKRPYWRDDRNRRNRYRCRDAKGVRCKNDCNVCYYARLKAGPQGNDYSLDGMLDEEIYENGIISDGFEMFIEMSMAREIRETISKMDEKDQFIISKLGEGYTSEEIAEMMGVVKSSISKRRKKIQKKLEKFRK